MSTYYYLICEGHRTVSRVIGGRSFPHRWWANNEGELEQFLEAHSSCEPAPVLASEHDERTYEYERMSADQLQP